MAVHFAGIAVTLIFSHFVAILVLSLTILVILVVVVEL